jgi:hypothetical protein
MTSKLARMALVATVVFGMGAGPARKAPPGHPPLVLLGGTLIAFGSMYGVDGPFVGEANPIRDTVGDELPWVVKGSARGRVDVDGHVKIRVRGLVFTDDEEVPPDMRGINDEDQFRARVSCLTEASETEVVTANVTTEGFPATRSGDADIDAKVTLPNPCVAPIVFILAGSEDKWFAVTGFEAPGAD